jgi:TPR repeat protein
MLDVVKAESLFLRAGTLGDVFSLYHLGYMQEKGLGTPINLIKAQGYYEQASKFSSALNNLGYIHQYYTPIDLIKAKEYYYQAIALGNGAALHNLGFMYYNGIGIPKDELKGLVMLLKVEHQYAYNMIEKNLPMIKQLCLSFGTNSDLADALSSVKDPLVYELDKPQLLDFKICIALAQQYKIMKEKDRQIDHLTNVYWAPGGEGYFACKQRFEIENVNRCEALDN